MPFTSDPAVVASRWRPLTASETTIATVLLGDAEQLLRARVPQIEERMATGTLSSGLVVQTQAAMVIRVLRNPDAHRQEAVSVDDASRSWTIDNALSSGALYVSDAELATLSPHVSWDFAGSAKMGST